MKKATIVGISGEVSLRDDKTADERAEQLELLSSAGVAMAGSFDIRQILEETHRAASRLLGARPVDVVYLGRASIHARPLWFPEPPERGNLTPPERRELLAQASEVESFLARGGSESGRAAIPLRYQEDLLGLLLFARCKTDGAESLQLLSILAQHASTALRNIHLAQERIQFERLSAIGKMIGSIVHDFRGPLTAIRGYAGMLANLELKPHERWEYGRWMIEECDRLSDMVTELLEFTRAGRQEPDIEGVDLAEFLKSLVERVTRQYAGRGIAVELAPPERGCRLRMERRRLERAVWNLLANACQSMPGGGSLKLRSSKTASGISIEIEDEGCGIPEEIRHRIFEPFFSYGKSEGIGLGMATARRIVEEHGGTIEIQDGNGRGTLVRLRLPAISGSPDGEELEAQPSDRSSLTPRG